MIILNRIAKIGVVSIVVIGLIGSWVAGSILIAPAKANIVKPDDLFADDIVMTSALGDTIRGWWLAGSNESPSVIVVHGVNANRLAMLGRAKLYRRRGYSVFIFDLPAHGESSGEHISFGTRESSAVSEALRWVRANKPGKRVGVDGVSLGGASVLLRQEHIGFDAIVLEAVFPDIHRAILNRLTDRFGALGYALEPLLTIQLITRLHEWPSDLEPINQIAKVKAPILLIGGEKDRLTTINETRELFDKAMEPKSLWIVPGSGHADFLQSHAPEFERIVVNFFDQYLKK
jgi:pimeloyl-ACP methyl ester carboxylesterase